MSIAQLRKKIDTIDTQILKLLARRLTVAKQIGKLKQKSKLGVHDTKREQELLSALTTKASGLGLEKKFISSIWRKVFIESKRIQRPKS